MGRVQFNRRGAQLFLLLLTHNVKDKAVISIEGVKASDGTLHAVNKHLSPKTPHNVVFVRQGKSCLL
ncbi:MAG: hypothetical protein Ct9H90mP25_4140 [Gammaproteobacteria bacterium]|nr:MAG: hypothetical protein Ct9H90mP25_4140 [Gammaproteobacteria bacterium]